MQECELIRRDIDGLKQEITEMRNDISGLVEAWRTASGVVRFVKWSAALATALAALTVSAKVGADLFIHALKESIK